MKNTFIHGLSAAIALIAFLVSCTPETDYDSRIKGLENRIVALEKLAEAQKNGDVITSVVPISENGVLKGYHIVFRSTAPIDVLFGEDGDSMFQSVTVGESEVTFVTVDGKTFVVNLAGILGIEFDTSDLVVMAVDVEREIHYTVSSDIDDITVEALGSGGVKAKVVETGDKTGVIRVKISGAIDEFSKVVVLVSNGARSLMRTLHFEQEAIQVQENTAKRVSNAGGEVSLEFFSNVDCQALIPADATGWVSVVPGTRSLERKTIVLAVKPNAGTPRRTTVWVQSNDGLLSLAFTIDQGGDHDTMLAIEREALIAIYHALDGDHWVNHENWCTDSPVGEWFGIEVYDDASPYAGHVGRIQLTCNNLRGTLDMGLMRFFHLLSLVISENRDLQEGNTQLSLVFPKQAPECSDSIDELDLMGCLMPNDLPEWFFHFPRLSKLQIPCKTVPPGLGSLTNLKRLNIITSPKSHLPDEIGNLSKLSHLTLQADPQMFPGDDVADSGNTIPDSFGRLEGLASLMIHNMEFSGSLPESMVNLSNLTTMMITWNSIPGPVPSVIGEMTSLRSLNLNSNGFSGPFPSFLCNLQLQEFSIANNSLSGPLPEDLGRMLDSINVDQSRNVPFDLSGNAFSGDLPKSLTSHPNWKYVWPVFVRSGYFDHWDDVIIPGPSFHGVDILGNEVDSDAIFKGNALTILYKYPINYGDNPHVLFHPSVIKDICAYFQDSPKKLGVVMWDINSHTDQEYAAFKQNYGSDDWIYLNGTIAWDDNGELTGAVSGLPNYAPGTYNYFNLVDSNGNVVFDEYRDFFFTDYSEVADCISKYLNGESDAFYRSSDYSMDGKVRQIQQATVGKGIDLVIMGDGFSDRQINEGLFDAAAEKAVTAFFSEEPYRSFRDCFSVRSVSVVSENEGIGDGRRTALKTYFGNETRVGGKVNNVIRYTLKTVPMERMDDALVLVLMNKDAYAGTCSMYSPTSGDYGRGLSIAFIPTYSDPDVFNGLVSHEAGGHGFAKLADEYVNGGTTMPLEVFYEQLAEQAAYGWWKNIDSTANSSKVKWSRFIGDERFADERIGCYEGAYGVYPAGVWRPTENSIMRYNIGGFNAPSRFAIWYRINKLAYGENWNRTYEDFVAYDVANRTTTDAAGRKALRQNYVEKPLPPLASPVIIDHSWREDLELR